MQNREIEAKFLEINKLALIENLKRLGAEDRGQKLLKETIFYDKAGKWIEGGEGKKFVRIRQDFDGLKMTYKYDQKYSAIGTEEIEFGIDSAEQARAFIETLGLKAYREQEKVRHKFKLGEVAVDIDTWPKVPTYVELEGPTEEAIKEAAVKLGFDWGKAVFGNAARVINQYYGISVWQLKFFTFEKVE